MHSLCLAMRFRKIPLEGCVQAWYPKMIEIFGKSTSPRDFVVLGGPAGGSALERASPPTGPIIHDSESLSALKSNMGAGEI